MSNIRKRVHRPAASATWEHEHRWGSNFGDSTTLRVTRTDGGRMHFRYGHKEFEVPAALVSILAEMTAAAAAWSDDTLPRPTPEGDPR